jgi:drug/metabolite transporter superfamily protein YnfA
MKRGDAKMKRFTMAFLAGLLFALAGFVEIVIGLAGHGSVYAVALPLGGMFVVIGMMWIAIGAKWKKDAERLP